MLRDGNHLRHIVCNIINKVVKNRRAEIPKYTHREKDKQKWLKYADK